MVFTRNRFPGPGPCGNRPASLRRSRTPCQARLRAFEATAHRFLGRGDLHHRQRHAERLRDTVQRLAGPVGQVGGVEQYGKTAAQKLLHHQVTGGKQPAIFPPRVARPARKRLPQPGPFPRPETAPFPQPGERNSFCRNREDQPEPTASASRLLRTSGRRRRPIQFAAERRRRRRLGQARRLRWSHLCCGSWTRHRASEATAIVGGDGGPVTENPGIR